MADKLAERGSGVNRKRIYRGHFLRKRIYRGHFLRLQRLVRLLGTEATYPKPSTSEVAEGREVRPYLVRDVAPERANRAWAQVAAEALTSLLEPT